VAARATLAKALENQGVAVSEAAGRVTLTLRAQSQFGSGAERIDPALHASLRAIGQALDRIPGAISVVGYTDATPVRGTGRHASNQELSLARARSAAGVIAAALGDPRRVKVEGKGDAEPLAPSDTPQNRARNRRVAIVLSPAP
jgi:type VI secretion system protein ImpK